MQIVENIEVNTKGEGNSGYAFTGNKGCGTRDHYGGLKALGMCPVHWRTFLKNLPESRKE